MRTPPDPETFNHIVWRIVQKIPEGQVSTYGQIASMIPPPDEVDEADYRRFRAQWVGDAMNEAPRDGSVPWQRVINSQGKSSMIGRAAVQQRNILEEEGVMFDAKERVDFEVYAWDGPEDTFLRAFSLRAPQSLKKGRSDDGAQQLRLF